MSLLSFERGITNDRLQRILFSLPIALGEHVPSLPNNKITAIRPEVRPTKPSLNIRRSQQYCTNLESYPRTEEYKSDSRDSYRYSANSYKSSCNANSGRHYANNCVANSSCFKCIYYDTSCKSGRAYRGAEGGERRICIQRRYEFVTDEFLVAALLYR